MIERSSGTGRGGAAGSAARSAAARVLVVGLCAALASAGGGHTEVRRATIVDQLEQTHPNPAFVQEATAILDAAGFTVDYVPGDAVTVDFFRSLPQRGDDLVLLRVHSARRQEGEVPSDEVALFTGELIDLLNFDLRGVGPAVATAVTQARRASSKPAGGGMNASSISVADHQHISPVFYDPGEPELPKFGIRSSFFEDAALGRFDGSTIVIMGCDALRSDGMARALVGRGAASVIGWTAAVSAEHTDAATLALLRAMYQDAQEVDESVSTVMSAVGEDPTFGAHLRLYRP